MTGQSNFNEFVCGGTTEVEVVVCQMNVIVLLEVVEMTKWVFWVLFHNGDFLSVVTPPLLELTLIGF